MDLYAVLFNFVGSPQGSFKNDATILGEMSGAETKTRWDLLHSRFNVSSNPIRMPNQHIISTFLFSLNLFTFTLLDVFHPTLSLQFNLVCLFFMQ